MAKSNRTEPCTEGALRRRQNRREYVGGEKQRSRGHAEGTRHGADLPRQVEASCVEPENSRQEGGEVQEALNCSASRGPCRVSAHTKIDECCGVSVLVAAHSGCHNFHRTQFLICAVCSTCVCGVLVGPVNTAHHTTSTLPGARPRKQCIFNSVFTRCVSHKRLLW